MFKVGDLVVPKNDNASSWYWNGLRLAEIVAKPFIDSIAIHILAYEGHYYDCYIDDSIMPPTLECYFDLVHRDV